MAVVVVEGLNELIAKLEYLGQNSKDVMHTALKAGGMKIQGNAKKLCPVDTGELRNSITVYDVPKGIAVGTNCEYAVCVEFGTGIHGDASVPHTTKKYWTYKRPDTGQFVTTSGQPPQPYLHPALLANEKAVRRIVKSEFKKAIEQAIGRRR